MVQFRRKWGPDGHPTEAWLEEYSFGRLDEADAGRVEEHLMLCEGCRESLEHVERFIQAMKTAILEERQAEAQRREGAGKPEAVPWWGGWRTWAWGGAVAAAVLVAVIAWPSGQPLTPAPIALASFRGSQEVTMARGPAGRPLDLALDATGLDDGARCRVEVVTLSGAKTWDGVASPEGGKALAHVGKGLRSGGYWVRLYGPDDELVREFGMRLE